MVANIMSECRMDETLKILSISQTVYKKKIDKCSVLT
jgi:hypothetical protein